MDFDVTDYLEEQDKGGVVAGVDFQWNKRKIKGYEQKFIQGLINMGFDIRNKAVGKAPWVTGALRNSIRLDHTQAFNNGIVEVIAGGISAPMDSRDKRLTFKGLRFVDYAWKREKGPNRRPETEHYMERSLDEVMRSNWEQIYFGGVTK